MKKNFLCLVLFLASFLMTQDQLGTTTEMFQILVLLNHSEAPLPLEGELQSDN